MNLGLFAGNGSAVANTVVHITSSDGTISVNVLTDSDGFYMYFYKYTGKAQAFTVSLTNFPNIPPQSITVKSNSFNIISFQIPYQVVFS